MLYRDHCNAVYVQYFRRYRNGRYLLRCDQSYKRKSKGKENQRTDVCSYGSLYPEICVLIKEPPGAVQNTEYASDTVQITAFYAAAHKIPVRI